jgi:hypothetical protein
MMKCRRHWKTAWRVLNEPVGYGSNHCSTGKSEVLAKRTHAGVISVTVRDTGDSV